MEISLKGRSAVITGGSKGLGLACAVRMAASGADVAVVARDKATLAAAERTIKAVAKGKVATVSCDVSKAPEVQRGYDEAMKALGRIDILMNNAGASSLGAFETLTDDIWQADFDLKLFSAIRFSRLAWPQMKERRWGRIINTLSTWARTPTAGSAPTTITRAAGLTLTKVMAQEGAAHNIMVNAMMVGSIESDQVRRQAETLGITTDEMRARYAKNIPLGRIGESEEFANLACFLASDQASFIGGATINVDGGASPA